MTIAALLSGGVDSSVAVHLLCEQGLKPDLFYIKIGMDDRGFADCPHEEDMEIVRAMARRYGLCHEVVDLQREYWDEVVAYTVERVRRGLTPNPDVMCNRLIKFGAFDRKVGHLYDKTATGHYATLVEQDGRTWLGTTPDPVKDQTDFLAQLDGFQVSHSLFPIGHMVKNQVRDLAEAVRLPAAHRKDSQGICFLGKIDYNQFIERFLGRREGPIVEVETGRILGRHQGYWFHTIGQRKGLGLGGGPWFVCRKDVAENVIYVSRGYDPEAQKTDRLAMADLHFITACPWTDAELAAGVDVLFKIRHVPELTRGRLSVRSGAGEDASSVASCGSAAAPRWHVHSAAPLSGVAPGQFCVVYTADGRICLGSGEIAWQ